MYNCTIGSCPMVDDGASCWKAGCAQWLVESEEMYCWVCEKNIPEEDMSEDTTMCQECFNELEDDRRKEEV